MPPQVNTATFLEPDIETRLHRHLRQTLKACGFDIRDTADCGTFLTTLQKFLKYIAERFAHEIDLQLKDPGNTHSRADLISWAISEIQILQAITFNRLERFIADSELKQSGLAAIDCVTASGYTFRLSEIYRAADSEWKSNREIEPSSSKHQRKRKYRRWAPYFVILWPASSDR